MIFCESRDRPLGTHREKARNLSVPSLFRLTLEGRPVPLMGRMVSRTGRASTIPGAASRLRARKRLPTLFELEMNDTAVVSDPPPLQRSEQTGGSFHSLTGVEA